MSTASPSDVRVHCALVFMARAGAPACSSRARALNHSWRVLRGVWQMDRESQGNPLIIDGPLDLNIGNVPHLVRQDFHQGGRRIGF